MTCHNIIVACEWPYLAQSDNNNNLYVKIKTPLKNNNQTLYSSDAGIKSHLGETIVSSHLWISNSGLSVYWSNALNGCATALLNHSLEVGPNEKFRRIFYMCYWHVLHLCFAIVSPSYRPTRNINLLGLRWLREDLKNTISLVVQLWANPVLT